MPSASRMRRAGKLIGVAGAVGALCASALAATPADAAPAHSEPIVQDLVSKELRNQELSWHECNFDDQPEPTRSTLLAVEGLACATITVPRNWYRAQDGNTIEVEISKAPATDPDKRRGVMLINPGGPGGSGLPWGPAMQLRSPDIGEAYDTIGFDPRGVGQSTPLICTYDQEAETQADAAKQYAEGCLDNPLTPFITTRQTTLDMDFIRYLLDEKKMNYIGYSYGTWLGGNYAATFPSKTDRFILDSATDMSQGTLESTWDLQPATRDRQFQDMMLPYMARHDDVYGMGDDPMEIRRAFEGSGGFDNYFNIIFGINTVIQSMYTTAAYEDAAAIIAVLSSFDDNDREEFRLPYGEAAQAALPGAVDQMQETLNSLDVSDEVKERVSEQLDQGEVRYGKTAEGHNQTMSQTTALAQDYGAFEAIRCQDGQWTQDLDVWEEKLDYGFKHAPLTGMLNSIPPCAFWPAQERDGFPSDIKDNKLPGVLFVQSEFDAATAYEGAENSIKKFKKSKAIIVDNEGTHGLFPYGTECVDKPALTFLLDGKLPKKKWTPCVGVPLPNELSTYNVGGTINKNGKLADYKLESDSVKEANEMVADFREDAGIPDVPGGDEGVVSAALPVK